MAKKGTDRTALPIKVVAFDGDDTLWHNETHFNFTQSALRDLLRAHAPDADIDERLFVTEMANLSLYGYGIKSFTLSMIETAIEVTDGKIPASDLMVILDWGKRMLREPTELLDGVRETLLVVSQKHEVLLITKGDLFDQESKLARSGLADRFAGVEVLSDKTVDSYRRVLTRRGIKLDEFVMVGNSLRSDVAPVVELGARAVYIPYHLTWHHEVVDEASLPTQGWFKLNTITGLSELLSKLDGEAQSAPRRAVRHKLQSRPDRNKKRNSGPLPQR